MLDLAHFETVAPTEQVQPNPTVKHYIGQQVMVEFTRELDDKTVRTTRYFGKIAQTPNGKKQQTVLSRKIYATGTAMDEVLMPLDATYTLKTETSEMVDVQCGADGISVVGDVVPRVTADHIFDLNAPGYSMAVIEPEIPAPR
ncbi:hypothetical protein H7Y63_02915 [Polaromonas sp.]|nr:hypothetical protein [Candidatus Saccharibacteria bacterium]